MTSLVDLSSRICSKCKKNTVVSKKTGHQYWYFSKITGKLLCNPCYCNERYRTEPEYREKQITRSKRERERKRKSNRNSKKRKD